MYVCACKFVMMSHHFFHECIRPHACHLMQALGDPVVRLVEIAVIVLHVAHANHLFACMPKLVILDSLGVRGHVDSDGLLEQLVKVQDTPFNRL